MKPCLPWLMAAVLCLLPAAVPTAKAQEPAISAEEARARELEAEIERRTQAYRQQRNLRRKQIAGTVTERRFERYLAGFRRKIACSSSLHYPEEARGKTYGEMIVTVSVLADGSIEKVRIDQGSGSKTLDDGAIEIARRAAPFAPFPPAIRTDTDALDITRTWTFTHEEGAKASSDPCR